MTTRYDHLTREELQAVLVKRDAERKLGLVWERNELERETSEHHDFIVADLDRNLSVGEAPYRNLLIEGDNKDVLRFLNLAFRGRIQCIYIDPPYNRGNRDFVYNDRYVSKEDSFRHSKWLEYLYQRFIVARDLLSPDGVILVSIDDDNRAKLELLLDQAFPSMRVGSLVWRKRRPSNAANIDYFFSSDHEHVLVYAREAFAFSGAEKRWSGYTNWDEDRKDSWASDNLTLGFTREQRPNLYYPLHNPKTDIWYPCDPNRVWTYASRERLQNREVRVAPMEDLIAQGRVHFPPESQVAYYDNSDALKHAIEANAAPPFLSQSPDVAFWVGKNIGYNKPRFKRFKNDLRRSTQPLSSWIAEWGKAENSEENPSFEIESGMTQEGTKALRELGLDFSYPKPPSLLRNLIAQASDPDAIVLDFFAGSATTAQAVMEVNAQDNGRRRFIMVSSTEATERNPERNICRDVAQKRIAAVLQKSDDGDLGSDSCAYLRVQGVSTERVSQSLRDEQVWVAVQLMHTQHLIPYGRGLPFQFTETPNGMLVYLPRVEEEVLRALVDEIETVNGHVLVYTWQPGILTERFEQDSITIEKIPDRLMAAFGGRFA